MNRRWKKPRQGPLLVSVMNIIVLSVDMIIADVSWICIIVDVTIRTFTHEAVCQLEPGQSHVAISQLSYYYSSNVAIRYYKVLVTA